MMRTDNGRIDHLKGGVAQSASSERLQDHIPDAAVGPPPKLPKDRVPVAEFLRQIAPRHARSRDPQHGVDKQPVVRAVSPLVAVLAWQKPLDTRPLRVRQFPTNQSPPPSVASLNHNCDDAGIP
jgi:hypothetical protein